MVDPAYNEYRDQQKMLDIAAQTSLDEGQHIAVTVALSSDAG